jgi:Glycoside hydrolase 97.
MKKKFFTKVCKLLPVIPVIVAALVFQCCSSSDTDTKVTVISPDSDLRLEMSYDGSLTYNLTYKGKEVIESSSISLSLSDRVLGENPKVKEVRTSQVDEKITPPYGKFSILEDKYNEAIIEFEGGYSLMVRAYNEGVAYHFVTDLDGEIIVRDEQFDLNLNGDPAVQFPETDNWTSWELTYIDYNTASAIKKDKKAITPVLFSFNDGIKLVVAESDLRDYPGMYLKKDSVSFSATFAQYPDSVALGSWGDFVSVVQRRADYIAKTDGKRSFPWRVLIVTDDDKALLTNEIIYKLAEPQKITDTSWIKPGKASWEWWHDALLPGADIPSGMDNRNTALYKHYIDFAAENGLEYMMVDAGWSHIFDLSQVNPRVDIQEVIKYANSKNVGVFLWCVAMALTDETTDKYMQMIRDWGAVGLKVDFFDRDDQLAVEWYEKIAAKAAEHHLMINFHGCGKPTGLQRTYPNILNFEAVRGAECAKWDITANPKHHLVFPFTRMLSGSLDYTPGSMRNRTRNSFKPVDPGLPMTMGTRCHELAMYVVYDQYFAMLCDSPSEYRKYPDIMKFLSAVPVSFDYTKVLEAKVGEYAVIAKQKGNDWYIGGMTDWTTRQFNIDFSFLPKDEAYIAEIYRDGDNANANAEDYIYEEKQVNHETKESINLASGGGFVIKLRKI